MPIEVAPFGPSDIDEAFALWRRTEGIVLTFETAALVEECLARSPATSFVVRDSGALVAAVLCTLDGRRAYLSHLAVERSHRGRGIGRSLVAHCIAALETTGVPRCHLFVHRSNAAAIPFWEHLGWSVRDDLQMMSRTIAARR
jgi:ribosomal protein S18 acetylase RimI-like enzyme